MNKYAETKDYILYHSDMNKMDEDIEKNSIDSIITDPPYELNFMGKGWDNRGVAFNADTWKKCFDVLKPGGYLLAFGGSRTYHRICCAIEDAGFEIRDCIMWLYGSGFPKSMNIGLAIDKKNGVESKVIGTTRIGKTSLGDNSGWDTSENMKKIKQSGEYEVKEAQNEWNGWGTCLKPAYEPIIVARKPFKGSLVDNVLKNGVGGLNIHECRVGEEEMLLETDKNRPKATLSVNFRFPANVILDDTFTEEWSRYFYCAKASKKDRDEGLEKFETKTKVFNGKSENSSEDMKDVEKRFTTQGKNIHPTVKPTQLMQYLVRLVTPKGGTIMDCFMGSGSTGKAVMLENKEKNAGYKFIGIEMTDEYLPIAEARINYTLNKDKFNEEKKLKEDKENILLNIFDFIKEN